MAAPDLDGDGTRQLIAVSLFDGRNPPPSPSDPDERRVYADALSGKDGRSLWVWNDSLPVATFAIWAPKWWGHGPDGWPMLAVAVGGGPEIRLGEVYGMSCGAPERFAEPEVHVLERRQARSGIACLVWEGRGSPIWTVTGLAISGEVEGELRAFRGEGPRPGGARTVLARQGIGLGVG